jgi:hypothetical protein
MALPYNKPWDELSPAEKAERVRKELQTFIDFFNGSVLQRNAERSEVANRLTALEATVRRIETQLKELTGK